MQNNSQDITAETIKKIVDVARLAPSVHNTQAWKVKIGPSSCQVIIDKRYALSDGDPTGRQAVIGIGIFCEALVAVAADFRLQTTIGTYLDGAVTVHFHNKPTKQTTKQPYSELIASRATDRSIYKPVDITDQNTAYLSSAAIGSSISIHVIRDKKQIDTIAELTSHGISLALTSPAFRQELSQYLVLPWSKKVRGISVMSLYIPTLVAIIEPTLMRLGIGLPLEAKLEKRRWQSASAVIAITADGDLTKYWFDVGRTYLRLSLYIEDLGLSQATSGAIVEASNYHEDVESILDTNQRILSMIRIGKGAKKRHHSPRISLDELTASN